jgi:hypothetical protein
LKSTTWSSASGAVTAVDGLTFTIRPGCVTGFSNA